MKETILSSVNEVIMYTLHTLQANGFYLILSIIIAVALSVYLDPQKTREFFLKRNRSLISGSVGLGALTPLCACGTMAVVISLLTTALPWGPVMAFLVSSPLMSPDTFVLISGFMGVKFAIVLAVSSILIGLSAGYLTVLIEKKSTFLNDQFRVVEKVNEVKAPLVAATCCSQVKLRPQDLFLAQNCCRASAIEIPQGGQPYLVTVNELIGKLKIDKFLKGFYNLGVKKILPLFLLFVVIAFVVKTYIPTEWTIKLFNGNNIFSVPIAALVGLPLYVSDAAVAPLLQVLKESGASQGSLLAFMIAGPGTSLAVIVGLNVVMKKRALLLYVLYVFLGSILLGYTYDYLNTIFL